MHSLADDLPSEVAQSVHPDWRKNEADFWIARASILSQYRDQWIAFANGRVIASGPSPVEVFREASESGEHPFVVCVGHEDEPTRMRRAEFSYDAAYPNEALPLMSVEFRNDRSNVGVVLDRVIPDTGADASALPWADCQLLHLDPANGIPGLMGGVGRSSVPTLAFIVWAHLDGKNYACRVQADFDGDERILGRDVLNRMDVLFRGPSGIVIVNP